MNNLKNDVLQINECNIIEPEFIALRHEQINQQTEYKSHSHTFGQLLYVVCGIMEMEVEGKHYMAPPEFCIWIPANTQHASFNKQSVKFRIIDFAKAYTPRLANKACVVRLSPIFHTIMTDMYQRGIVQPETAQDIRLGEVLIDQFAISPCQDTYLPTSKDKFLAPILNELQQDPADNTTLAQWAKRFYTSERTLSRRCQQELGMSFSEWRQRLRYLHAVAGLDKGKSVHEVAFDVGYSSASAFIAMFQQISGVTPDRFRMKELAP
ncbi:AraC family transcriptional regulator [Providencia alcalifaciens]|uniref:Arabinose operon regulatory protein n=1 Tax=Providencia alcalifaciens 205/92 TaxID=1256988 RepID=A0AAV3M3S4_9GAMM|nr:helix-turn-helix transcriptional regulator [Providencia alcalifaciens]EUD10184.1 DNA-binding helix-turn-helix protein [Providencia alcalifaciens 205/92]MTC63897.1 helix-turn-helix domain-containing protein [Providencia alcalifaciens]WGZ54329.1 helix-turn-helix transcriptional regulator [Providencia alcalifaciens]